MTIRRATEADEAVLRELWEEFEREVPWELFVLGPAVPELAEVVPLVGRGVLGALEPWKADGGLFNHLGDVSDPASPVLVGVRCQRHRSPPITSRWDIFKIKQALYGAITKANFQHRSGPGLVENKKVLSIVRPTHTTQGALG